MVTSPATHSLGNAMPQPRPDGTPDMTIGRDPTGARAWFSLPDLDEVMDWVNDAGTDGHRASEYWEGWIRPWCLTSMACTHATAIQTHRQPFSVSFRRSIRD